MFSRLSRFFGLTSDPLVVKITAEQQIKAAQERQRQRQLHDKHIACLHELGGFDTFFEDSATNWARQAEVLVEFKRRLDAIETKLSSL